MLIKQDCFYCGSTPVKRDTKNAHLNGFTEWNGLDRVDSLRGYTINNVVTCCSVCNRMKLNLSLDLFLQKVKLIYFRCVEGKDDYYS